ncbi:MAG TPA: polyprenyl synthetase family protein [Candidatus Bathyarchaeota archaeon]|nr:polyprenyl synthetase family protein [Candidatus Bathyarchaeota archaeon]
MEDLTTLLKRYAVLVNEAIERYVPRRFDESYVRWACGEPRYAYDTEALTEAIAKPFWDLLDRGGKRWRPAFMLMVYEAISGWDAREVLDFAVIPEVIHNGTLIVDDVEDDSELRRGKPCVHRIYGTDIAINAGNTMYYLPLTVVLRSDKLDERTKLRIYEMYIQEMLRLSFGQAMDIAWHRGIRGADVSEEQYLQMCAYKTGTLARFAAKLGAILAKAPDWQVESIGRFAEAIGVAFQIQDDILNITGDPEAYGKEWGGDITEGKRTLMVIYTLRRASEADRRRLLQILDMHTRDKHLIKEAVSIMERYGAVEYARKVARRIVEEAWADVDGWLSPSEAKEALKALARFLIERAF